MAYFWVTAQVPARHTSLLLLGLLFNLFLSFIRLPHFSLVASALSDWILELLYELPEVAQKNYHPTFILLFLPNIFCVVFFTVHQCVCYYAQQQNTVSSCTILWCNARAGSYHIELQPCQKQELIFSSNMFILFKYWILGRVFAFQSDPHFVISLVSSYTHLVRISLMVQMWDRGKSYS